jgi:NosR/NirI family transcriptional regulator, nitrous oxide reductase regulator
VSRPGPAHILIAVLSLAPSAARGADRFPLPDFPPGYTMPTTTVPDARSDWLGAMDLAVLVAALVLASVFALVLRSRLAMAMLVLFTIGYFGFYRRGCICPVGSIQNAAGGFFAGSPVPWIVLAFFLLPLAASLVAGRTFCAGVCPLGAIQDVVLLRPLKVPLWLEHVLGMGPWVFLGSAATLAALGAGYIICRYDPFVAFYRLAGPLHMLVAGGLILAVAMFIGRPYCRFVCPYGALLRPLAALSWRHATITPAECVNCRLCEDACPYNAIQRPTPPPKNSAPATRGKWLLAGAMALLPAMVLGGACVMGLAGGPLSRLDFSVRMDREARLEERLRGAEKMASPSPLHAAGTEYAFAQAGAPGEEQLVVRAIGREGNLWTSPPLGPAKTLLSPAAVAGLALTEDGNTLWAIIRQRLDGERLDGGREAREASPRDVYDLVFLDPRGGTIMARRQYRLDVNVLRAYHGANLTPAALAERAESSLGRFTWAARGLGAFLGLIFGAKLVHLSVRRRREFYQIDKARCVSCGRCFRYCPVPRGGLAGSKK